MTFSGATIYVMLYLLNRETFKYIFRHKPILVMLSLLVFVACFCLFFIYVFLAIKEYNDYEIRLLDVLSIGFLSFCPKKINDKEVLTPNDLKFLLFQPYIY